MYNKQTRPRSGEASSLFFAIFPQFLSKSRNFMWKYKASFTFFATFAIGKSACGLAVSTMRFKHS